MKWNFCTWLQNMKLQLSFFKLTELQSFLCFLGFLVAAVAILNGDDFKRYSVVAEYPIIQLREIMKVITQSQKVFYLLKMNENRETSVIVVITNMGLLRVLARALLENI